MSYIVKRRVYRFDGAFWDENVHAFETYTEAKEFVDGMNDQFTGEFYFLEK